MTTHLFIEQYKPKVTLNTHAHKRTQNTQASAHTHTVFRLKVLQRLSISHRTVIA